MGFFENPKKFLLKVAKRLVCSHGHDFFFEKAQVEKRKKMGISFFVTHNNFLKIILLGPDFSIFGPRGIFEFFVLFSIRNNLFFLSSILFKKAFCKTYFCLDFFYYFSTGKPFPSKNVKDQLKAGGHSF